MENPTCIHSCLDFKARCRVSYLTLHKMGYIMTSSPIAVPCQICSTEGLCRLCRQDSPIGTDTPTKCPFCNAGAVCSTKFPSSMPMAMANIIHTARNRSSQPSPLNADTLSGTIACSILCFSTSVGWTCGGPASELVLEPDSRFDVCASCLIACLSKKRMLSCVYARLVCSVGCCDSRLLARCPINYRAILLDVTNYKFIWEEHIFNEFRHVSIYNEVEEAYKERNSVISANKRTPVTLPLAILGGDMLRR